MEQLKKCLASLTKELKAPAQKTDKIVKGIEKIEKAQAKPKKKAPKPKRTVKRPAAKKTAKSKAAI